MLRVLTHPGAIHIGRIDRPLTSARLPVCVRLPSVFRCSSLGSQQVRAQSVVDVE